MILKGGTHVDTWIIVLIIAVVVLGILAALFFYGKKLQAKQSEQESLINQSKMTTSILVIDKKKMKITKAKLPKIVVDQVPKYLRWRKVPIVKAKIGPKISSLMCDEKVFKILPTKKMVKVDIAGMYIVAMKGAKK